MQSCSPSLYVKSCTLKIWSCPSHPYSNMLFYLSFLLLYIPTSSAFPKSKVDLDERSFHGDPGRNITCLGSSYDLQLPVRSAGVDAPTTIQERNQLLIISATDSGAVLATKHQIFAGHTVFDSFSSDIKLEMILALHPNSCFPTPLQSCRSCSSLLLLLL